jgi:hypothetical protein
MTERIQIPNPNATTENYLETQNNAQKTTRHRIHAAAFQNHLLFRERSHAGELFLQFGLLVFERVQFVCASRLGRVPIVVDGSL